MKNKLLMLCLLSVICVLTVSSSYAGDIPESLLCSDEAEVYFGEVIKVDEKSVTVIQRIHIKGEFVQDREVTYAPYGYWGDGWSSQPRKGKMYLIGKSDANNITIVETEGTDPATLKLTHRYATTEGTMAHRLQEYLNNGDFAEAEAKRVARKEAEAKRNSAKASSEAAINQTAVNAAAASEPPAPKEEEKPKNSTPWTVWAISGIALAAAAGFVIYKFCIRAK